MADNELKAAKNGDKAAFEALLSRYEPLVVSEAVRMVARDAELRDEEEELRQEGRLAFYDAVNGYNESSEVTFGLYAKICIHNRLISYQRKRISAKKKAEKAALKGGVVRYSAAEELMIAYESSPRLQRFVSEQLTEFERRALQMYMEKMSYLEISAQLGKDVKSVDNALSRAKSKIKKLFL